MRQLSLPRHAGLQPRRQGVPVPAAAQPRPEGGGLKCGVIRTRSNIVIILRVEGLWEMVNNDLINSHKSNLIGSLYYFRYKYPTTVTTAEVPDVLVRPIKV